MSGLEQATPDDPATCAVCGKATSLAMIAVHLEREHGIDTSEMTDAPVYVEPPPAQRVYKMMRLPMTIEDWQRLGWSDEESLRLAQTEQSKTVVHVFARAGNGFYYELYHHVRHSPTGFEWGYAGSGPAELARCILIDFMGQHEEAEQDDPYARIPTADYQQFKRDFIVTAPKEGFEVTGEQIAAWLSRQGQAA